MFNTSTVQINQTTDAHNYTTNPITTSYLSTSEFMNFENLTTALMEPMVAEMHDKESCTSPYTLCNASLQESFCFNGGTCCHHEHTMFCACADEFEGPRCMRFKFMETLESSERTLRVTLVSSLTSLFIAIVCLAILIFVVIMAWKKIKEKKIATKSRTMALDSEILYVQNELEKLPASEKMNRLAKLSRIVEATARAAILSFPSLVSPQPFNPNKHPLSMVRSASEPTELNFQFKKFELDQVPRSKSAKVTSNGTAKTAV